MITMLKADLHLHSHHSLDGEWLVTDIVRACDLAGLSIISITDHNLVQGVAEALSAGRELNIRVVPGIEVDCQYMGIDLHVLGYNINWESKDFDALKDAIAGMVIERFPVMVENLSKAGIVVDAEEVLLKAGSNLPSGELIAEVLLNNDKYLGNEKLDPYRKGGHRSDMPYINFYHDYFSQGRPAYVKIDFMDYRDAIALIKGNGGIPVIAHPGLNLKGKEQLIEELLDKGAEGLEAFNNYHTHDQIDYFARNAMNKKLLVLCGSDFHGKTKPLIKPGVFRTIEAYEGYVAESIDRLRLRSA
jgi:3',5'-nucleoside bisphosphate phosphatase